MKRIFLILTALMMYAVCAMAQDIIVTKEGVDIKAQVLEVGTGTVRYRLFDEPDGAIYTMRKSDILMIRHYSGRNEVFKSASGYAAYREPVADIVPGMKYKDLKKIYNYSDWYSAPGDKTNPALMGVCSWLIPGLGQMISGELGRGFAWLGSSVGCYVLMGIGATLNASALTYDPYNQYYNEGQAIAGSIIALAGSLGLLAVDICAIVDACRVSKVRNMYEQDLRMNYSLELRPSVDYIRMAGSVQPTAGLTLAMTF